MKLTAFFSTTPDDLTEIVFAHRNRNYGAYELRRMHNKRMQQSLLATAAGLSLLFFLLLKFSSSNVASVVASDDPTVTISDVVPTTIPPKTPQPNMTPPSRSSKGVPTIVPNVIDTTTDVVDTASHQGVGTGKLPIDDGSDKKGGGTVAAIDTATNNDNDVKLFVEVMPEFPGGMNALMDYLSKRIDCKLWKESGESGNVVFSLVVGKDGGVSDITVLRDGVGFGCADQAKHVIQNMPKWKPGMQGNRPVNVKYILPVTYLKQ